MAGGRFFLHLVTALGIIGRMASISLPLQASGGGRARPLNIMRDLPRVADLIELCFASNMDNEGRSYVREMRRASNDNAFLHWANRAAEGASMLLSGVVWEQDGRIVGNASLMPFRRKGLRYFLIANVATHPDYRGRGIAHALTEEAIQAAHQRGADQVWLHVRADNPSAMKIYTDLGFEERARRTHWRVTDGSPPPPPQDSAPGLPTVTRREPRFWPQQRAWLDRSHPEELAWYRAWDWNVLQPGLWNWMYRFFVESDLRQWAALAGERLQAVLAWAPPCSEALWLACGPESEPRVVTALLHHARRELGCRRGLWLEHPAGLQDEAIQAAGFIPQRTLVWMRARGATL